MRRPAFKRRPIKRVQIDPRAVSTFLERELDDWRWIKEVPQEELFKLLPKGFPFLTDPRLHQVACFLIARKLHRFLFFLDMGAGKSKLLLDCIRYRKHMGELRGALVCVPNLINLPSWEDQLKEHAPDLTYRVLLGDRASRYEMLDETPPDVSLINYAGLPVYMANSKRATRKGTLRKDMVVEDAEKFSGLFNFIALDECHIGLGKVTSLQYQLTKYLSWRADFCYGMTGTPMGRDPIKMWPQFHVIDQGETMGHSLAMFRAAYFLEKEDFWKGIDYTFDNSKRSHLHQTMQHRSLRYEARELKRTPGALPTIRIPVQMSPAQLRANAALLRDAKQAREEEELPPAVYIKQRQITAGFLGVNAEDGTKLEVAFNPNPKVDALEQFLQELGAEKKLVIFHSYIYSGVLISDLLKRLNIKHCGVGHGYKDPTLQLRRFLADPTYRIFVANCAAGGTGVNGLQKVCNYALFYESPSSPVVRKQAESRLDRDGQKLPVYIYDLVARGIFVDQRCLDNIASGRDMMDAVVDGRETIRRRK
jgi:SNF2 family DNA or RNA helicase